MKKTFKFSLSVLLASLAILFSITAIGQGGGLPPTPTPARSFTHCSIQFDDCVNNWAAVDLSFELNILNLPGMYDYRVVIKLYRGVLRGGLAQSIQDEVLFTTLTSGPVSIALIPYNVVTTFTTTDFIPNPNPLSITTDYNGWYRATTTLQRLTTTGWVDVFATTPSSAYGYDDITWVPFGDFNELARVKTLRRSRFDFSINGDYCNSSTISEFFTCSTSPLILQDIQDWLGNNIFEASTLKIEKDTGSGWLPADSLLLSNNQNQNLNLTNLFSLNGYQGMLRITYEMSPDNCNGAYVRVFKQKTIKVTPVIVLADYGKPGCGGGCYKPIQTTLPITTPAPAINQPFNVFKLSIDNSVGWMGANSAGMYDLNTNGNWTMNVYEVDNAGARMIRGGIPSPVVSSYSDSGPWSGTLRFNDWGHPFDPANPPYYIGAGNYGADAYFKELYDHAKNGGDPLFTLTDFSNRVYCADLSVVDPTSGCSVVKKSYFKIANNGSSPGSNAKPALEEEESHPLPISVYPNPTSAIFTIAIPTGTVNASIKLTDNTGRILFENEHLQVGKNSIDVRQFPVGVYLYSLSVDGKIQHGKMAKQ